LTRVLRQLGVVSQASPSLAAWKEVHDHATAVAEDDAAPDEHA
jgi:hypothetical protein